MRPLPDIRSREHRAPGAVALAVAMWVSIPGPAVAAPSAPTTSCCGFTMEGTVWYDENGNGIHEATEAPLPGWTIELYDYLNNLVTSTVTDASGNYSITHGAGCGTTFTLKQVVPPGWNQTFPTAGGNHTFVGNGCGATLGPFDFGDIDNGCAGLTKVYTLDADFVLGTLSGVVTNSDQLELTPALTTWPYAWIANAGEGTLSKVDTQTGNEVARYFTGPPKAGLHYYLSPSRTVIDKDGNCWVANRTQSPDTASVTQILLSGGDDRDLDSIIDTSFDANANGVIDPGEILPWGQDERVKRHYLVGNVPGDLARGMVIDKAGFLWVGLSSSVSLLKLDPALPIATYGPDQPPSMPPPIVNLYTGKLPYGLALSPSGLIYMSTRSTWAFEIDPGLASGGTAFGPALSDSIDHWPYGNYGIAVDKDCNVWLASSTHPNCVRWDTGANTWTASLAGAPSVGRGITVDFNNNVWMTISDAVGSVVRYNNTPSPTVFGVYATGILNPIGPGISSDGNLIVTHATSPWRKLNTTSGALMTLPGPMLAGDGPYTYSDFTGSLQALSALQQGTWTVVTDGGSSAIVWTLVSWTPSTPPGTSVQIEARAAQTLPLLAGTSWTTIGIPGPLGTPMPGRYIETRARLQRTIAGCSAPFVTPILYDLTVQAVCDSCNFVVCPPDTTIPCASGMGAVFEYTPPVLRSTCDSSYLITCSPPSGSTFPIGTTPVVCTAANAYGDTVICQFSVTVLPGQGCDPTPTGACCTQSDCQVLTEHDCLQQGGVYFGDGSDCTVGCDDDCVSPPHHMVGWWRLDGASGTQTANLANPHLPGTLVGGPTPLPGEYVNASYGFDGASQYVETPDSPTFAMGTGDFSIDAWVKTSATGIQPILDKRGGVGNRGFALFLDDGYPALELSAGGATGHFALGAQNGGGAAFVADGQWHFVAVTVDRDSPTGIQFYVDGQRLGTPFDPTGHAGSLDSTAPIWIGRSHTSPVSWYFNGALDEIELVQQALPQHKIVAVAQALSAGKCPEECYATQKVPCCQGLTSTATVTICNWDVVSHVYSFGLSPISGGLGCGPTGPLSYSPASGTVTVPGGTCLNVPISIGCPSTIPVGTIACYQVSIFNHDTGRLFDCKGSVRITSKWCPKPIPFSMAKISEGESTPFHFEVENLTSGPATLDYTIKALAGDCCDRDDPSTALELNGLAPGVPVTGSRVVQPGQTTDIQVDVEMPIAWLIGYERIALYADEDGDSQEEKLAEVALRSFPSSLISVPRESTTPAGDVDPSRLFLAVPNPFDNGGQIRFRVPGKDREEVKLRLFDLNGRAVRVFLMEQPLEPGEHTVKWDALDNRGARLATGMYFLRLEVGKRREAVKIVVRR